MGILLKLLIFLNQSILSQGHNKIQNSIIDQPPYEIEGKFMSKIQKQQQQTQNIQTSVPARLRVQPSVYQNESESLENQTFKQKQKEKQKLKIPLWKMKQLQPITTPTIKSTNQIFDNVAHSLNAENGEKLMNAKTKDSQGWKQMDILGIQPNEKRQGHTQIDGEGYQQLTPIKKKKQKCPTISNFLKCMQNCIQDTNSNISPDQSLHDYQQNKNQKNGGNGNKNNNLKVYPCQMGFPRKLSTQRIDTQSQILSILDIKYSECNNSFAHPQDPQYENQRIYQTTPTSMKGQQFNWVKKTIENRVSRDVRSKLKDKIKDKILQYKVMHDTMKQQLIKFTQQTKFKMQCLEVENLTLAKSTQKIQKMLQIKTIKQRQQQIQMKQLQLEIKHNLMNYAMLEKCNKTLQSQNEALTNTISTLSDQMNKNMAKIESLEAQLQEKRQTMKKMQQKQQQYRQMQQNIRCKAQQLYNAALEAKVKEVQHFWAVKLDNLRMKYCTYINHVINAGRTSMHTCMSMGAMNLNSSSPLMDDQSQSVQFYSSYSGSLGNPNISNDQTNKNNESTNNDGNDVRNSCNSINSIQFSNASANNNNNNNNNANSNANSKNSRLTIRKLQTYSPEMGLGHDQKYNIQVLPVVQKQDGRNMDINEQVMNMHVQKYYDQVQKHIQQKIPHTLNKPHSNKQSKLTKQNGYESSNNNELSNYSQHSNQLQQQVNNSYAYACTLTQHHRDRDRDRDGQDRVCRMRLSNMNKLTGMYKQDTLREVNSDSHRNYKQIQEQMLIANKKNLNNMHTDGGLVNINNSKPGNNRHNDALNLQSAGKRFARTGSGGNKISSNPKSIGSKEQSSINNLNGQKDSVKQTDSKIKNIVFDLSSTTSSRPRINLTKSNNNGYLSPTSQMQCVSPKAGQIQNSPISSIPCISSQTGINGNNNSNNNVKGNGKMSKQSYKQSFHNKYETNGSAMKDREKEIDKDKDVGKFDKNVISIQLNKILDSNDGDADKKQDTSRNRVLFDRRLRQTIA